MKILLISGHGANDCGAVGYGVEREETRKVTNKLAELLKPYMEVVIYPQNRNAYADVYNGCFQVDLSGFDYVFEVHFNSLDNSTAHGTEIWVTPQEDSTKVEQGIVNKVAALGFTNRGVKSEQFAVISYAKRQGVSSALIETCFISNQSDMQTYNSKFEQVCQAMANGILEGYGIKSVVALFATTQPNKVDYKGEDQMFSENWYLNRYKDVADAVKKGTYKNAYDHYKQRGKIDKPNRLPLPPIPVSYCEGDYLALNTDVADAVKKGTFTSGVDHYMQFGFAENRKINKNESLEAIKKRIADLEVTMQKIKELVK